MFVGVNDCSYDVPVNDERLEPPRSTRLEGGNIRFEDGRFVLDLAIRSQPFASAPVDSVRVSGAMTRTRSLLALRSDDGDLFYGTIGPSLSEPTTVLLSSVAHPGGRKRIGGLCQHVVLLNEYGTEVDREVRNGGDEADDSYRFAYLLSPRGNERLPLFTGSPSSSRGGLRWDSARVALRRDGTYEATAWLAYAQGRGDGTYSPLTEPRRNTGRYVRGGSVIAFDPASGDRAFGVVQGDSLIVYDHKWGAMNFGGPHLVYAGE
ncbi:hypothetical protein [Rubrivirga sp.]|uniref:hypothetical protein n=1 Tax=Rubrivirga sp. TaxID=1885344 RepID=UPI003C74A0AA